MELKRYYANQLMGHLEIQSYHTFNRYVAIVARKHNLAKPGRKQRYGTEWVKLLAEYLGEPVEEAA